METKHTPTDYIDIVFDGPPSHESGRFVEVENSQGRSVKLGEWVEREDGLWALRIPNTVRLKAERDTALAALKDLSEDWAKLFVCLPMLEQEPSFVAARAVIAKGEST